MDIYNNLDMYQVMCMLDGNFMTKIKTESSLVWTGRTVEVCDGGCDYFDS